VYCHLEPLIAMELPNAATAVRVIGNDRYRNYIFSALFSRVWQNAIEQS